MSAVYLYTYFFRHVLFYLRIKLFKNQLIFGFNNMQNENKLKNKVAAAEIMVPFFTSLLLNQM